MKQVLIITGILFILPCIFSEVEGVSCKTCNDIDKPGNCRVGIPCGDGEICLTEEYTDVNGQQAYRLGCANAGRCRLFVNAKSIFGKREISPKCYECCDSDDCNDNLCQSSVNHVTSGGHVSTISRPTVHHTCPQSSCSTGCPQLFVPFKDKCYFISPTRESWTTAKKFCIEHGGNLVSVNSKEEHDFLKGLANQVNASFVESYWTGGFYLREVDEFEYVDGSPFNYTHWHKGYPYTSYSTSYQYYVVLGNPGFGHEYKDLTMKLSYLTSYFGCPQLFVPFKDKCYFISVNRTTAKKFCIEHGGNRVLVNSKEEHDFLKGLANQVNASFIASYWTGGFYLREVDEFEYVDGSLFNYTHWHQGYPYTSYSTSNQYYVVLGNPGYSHDYKDFTMKLSYGTSSLGIICESNKD